MEDVIGLDDLIDNLMECLAGGDSESIADAYNRICSTNIQPLGDDRYRHSDGGEIDGDDALKHISDCLAGNMDGEDIARHYNFHCSDQVVYEGDSLFSKIESD